MISGVFTATLFALTFSIRSSSTQPPDTDPTTCPSSRTTTLAPTGRGPDHQGGPLGTERHRPPGAEPAQRGPQDFQIYAIHAVEPAQESLVAPQRSPKPIPGQGWALDRHWSWATRRGRWSLAAGQGAARVPGSGDDFPDRHAAVPRK